MKREEDQQLWDFLGQAPRPQLSPFFARNVIRLVRAERQPFLWRSRILDARKLVPAAGVAAVVLAALVVLHRPAVQNPTETAPDVVAKIDPQDYDVVADLDQLIVSDENSLWDDDTQTL